MKNNQQKKMLEPKLLGFYFLISTIGLTIFISQTLEKQVNMKDLTKKEIKEKAELSIQEVLEGEREALDLYIESRKLIEYYKFKVSALEDLALEERQLYPEKELVVDNAKISISETGDRLDYLKDEEYASLKAQLKAREDLLKRSTKHAGILVDEEGEVIPKVPVKTFSKTVIKVSL